jgi:glycosyltransferase involved in cell wall biosynthesis
MTNRTLVSIVIDNFNYADFLREAIDSALGQTYSGVEIVVVDDGSTDSSREIIATYGNRIVPVLKENGGQASAFNAGLQASHGGLVCFLDADDVLAATALERAVPHFADPSIVKVHWPLWEVNASGTKTGKIFPISPLASGNLQEKTIDEGPLAYITSPTSGNAWSRRYLETVYPVAECGNRHGGDAYLSILAPLYGRIATVDDPQGIYRIHSRSFSGNQRFEERPPEMYAAHCRLLAEHLTRAGIAVDTKKWKLKQFAWHFAMKRAAREIRSVVPSESMLILIDNGAFGSGFPRGRQSLPFPERHEQYWGPPADDSAASLELERLQQRGAEFVAVTWPAFWWLDYYRAFAAQLRSRSHPVLENERLILFDLRPRPQASPLSKGL